MQEQKGTVWDKGETWLNAFCNVMWQPGNYLSLCILQGDVVTCGLWRDLLHWKQIVDVFLLEDVPKLMVLCGFPCSLEGEKREWWGVLEANKGIRPVSHTRSSALETCQ